LNAWLSLLSRFRATWQGAAAAWHSHPASVQAASQPQGLATSPPARAHELTEVLERSVDCVLQTDAQGRVTYINPAARQALGLPAEGGTARQHFHHFLARGALRPLLHEVLPALGQRGVWVGEVHLRLGLPRKRPFSLMALAHRGPDGQVARYSAVMRDISTDVVARQQIQRQNNILGAITEAMPATVVIVDAQGRYRFVNSAFERYVGHQAADILGRTAIEVLGADEVMRRKPYMMKAYGGEPVDFVLDYPGDEGTTWLALSCIPLKLDGVLDGFVGISQDITHQRREQQRLADLAERDPLTGLLNRGGLAQRLAHKRDAGEAHELAMLYIDLDHFKPVNDTMGHHTGDRLLQLFAHRLSETVRSSDVVARLGGDEFAILLGGVRSIELAETVADKVLAAASRPFDIDGHDVRVSASIGVAVMRPEDAGLRELLARADTMLYKAKAAGRGRQVSQRQDADVAEVPGA